MSRAADFALYLILLQASVGFVNSIHLFPIDYNAAYNNSNVHTLDDLHQYTGAVDNQPTAWDYFTTIINWTIATLLMAINMVISVAFILPTLVKDFGIPLELSLFIQAGVYFVYGLWYMQWKSGKPLKLYE